MNLFFQRYFQYLQAFMKKIPKFASTNNNRLKTLVFMGPTCLKFNLNSSHYKRESDKSSVLYWSSIELCSVSVHQCLQCRHSSGLGTSWATSSRQHFQRHSDVGVISSEPHELLPCLSLRCLFWPQLVVPGEPSGSVWNISGRHWCEVVLVSTEVTSCLLDAAVSITETEVRIMQSGIIGILPSSQTLVYQHRRDTVEGFWNQVTDQSI